MKTLVPVFFQATIPLKEILLLLSQVEKRLDTAKPGRQLKLLGFSGGSFIPEYRDEMPNTAYPNVL